MISPPGIEAACPLKYIVLAFLVHSQGIVFHNQQTKDLAQNFSLFGYMQSLIFLQRVGKNVVMFTYAIIASFLTTTL